MGVAAAAAAVLRDLAAYSPASQAAIAAAGSIPELVRLRGSSSRLLQWQAARTLHAVAAGSPANQQAIAAARAAVPQLRDLLSRCVLLLTLAHPPVCLSDGPPVCLQAAFKFFRRPASVHGCPSASVMLTLHPP